MSWASAEVLLPALFLAWVLGYGVGVKIRTLRSAVDAV